MNNTYVESTNDYIYDGKFGRVKKFNGYNALKLIDFSYNGVSKYYSFWVK